MTREKIVDRLNENHQAFILYIQGLNERDIHFSPGHQKWTAAQHADHIHRSLSPLRAILSLPVWLLRLLFSKASRPSRSYDELIERYRQRLGSGGKASGRFVPAVSESTGKNRMTEKIRVTLKGLCRSLKRFSERDLDQLVLPHPLLGKVTLREMLYFTCYHVQHHQQIAARDLASR